MHNRDNVGHTEHPQIQFYETSNASVPFTNLNPPCHMVPDIPLCQLKLRENSPSARAVEICVNHLSLLKSHFHAKPRARLAWGDRARFLSLSEEPETIQR